MPISPILFGQKYAQLQELLVRARYEKMDETHLDRCWEKISILRIYVDKHFQALKESSAPDSLRTLIANGREKAQDLKAKLCHR